uniref:Putative secreted protein n=1 Tax=Ixodes ricinus TaxID=34613 RepID=A0A6B0UL35_IXORI
MLAKSGYLICWFYRFRSILSVCYLFSNLVFVWSIRTWAEAISAVKVWEIETHYNAKSDLLAKRMYLCHFHIPILKLNHCVFCASSAMKLLHTTVFAQDNIRTSHIRILQLWTQ